MNCQDILFNYNKPIEEEKVKKKRKPTLKEIFDLPKKKVNKRKKNIN